MKKTFLTILTFFSITNPAFGAVHVYTASDWNAGTVLGATVSGETIQLENNASYSIVGDDSSVFPLFDSIPYYIKFSSTCTTGDIQFQASNGADHTVFSCSQTDQEFVILPTADSFLQIGGGSTNWYSDTDALISQVCISDVSFDECIAPPQPTTILDRPLTNSWTNFWYWFLVPMQLYGILIIAFILIAGFINGNFKMK